MKLRAIDTTVTTAPVSMVSPRLVVMPNGGAIAGAPKKQFGMIVTAGKVDGRGRVDRIE